MLDADDTQRATPLSMLPLLPRASGDGFGRGLGLPRCAAPKKFLAALVCTACLVFTGVSVARAEGPELAGVMVDPVDPGKSLAIIDGRRLRVGSRWQGLELTEIGEGFVRLHEAASGRERILTMGPYAVTPGTGRNRSHALDASSAAGRLVNDPRTRAAALGSATVVARTQAVSVDLARIPEQDFFERINPLRLVWMAYSAMAQASLRQIHTAQQLFAINDLNYDGRDQYSRSLRELADHSLVQADLATGEKFGYRFSVRAWEDKLGPHYECIAEPVRSDARQPYLYLDETGVIRGQLFARAGYNSSPIQ